MKLDLGKLTRKEKAFGILPAMGTLGILGMVNNFHELTHNNMRDTRHRSEDIENISGEALRNHAARNAGAKRRIGSTKGACYNCPIACTRMTKICDEEGRVVDHGEGPEFETVALLGANLSIYDLVTITEANYWANRYGLDTISLGGTIAALFDLYQTIKDKPGDPTPEEKAFLHDIQGFTVIYGEPRFGHKEVLLPLVHLIAKAEGIGERLAQGSYRFCAHYGHADLSVSVKKMELPAYDPRAAFLQGLCYEMNNRGGCHLENGYTAIRGYCAGYAEWPGDRIEGTAIIAKNAALGAAAIDIIGACAFASLSLSLDEFAALVTAVTGEYCNAGSLERLAWRILTLERIFNLLAGFSADDDRLPTRFYTEGLDIEGRRMLCNRVDFDQMHLEYYNAMGWDENGTPRIETLKQLGLTQLLESNAIRLPTN
jgi:aldehyde:ferredoxin oxidoreductase